MIADLKILLVKLALKYALKRAAPDRVPLTDKARLPQRNYYSVTLYDALSRGRFLVSDVRREGLDGDWFANLGGGYMASVPNRFINLLDLEIKHYYKEIEIEYRSALGFIFSFLTFGAHRALCIFRFRIWAFSKKKLPREDRIEVLSWAYKWTIENESHRKVFTPLIFLNKKYGDLVYYHPEKDKLIRHYRIVFESLVASGDLDDVKSSWSFSLSPKALGTLDQYEETDRRHTDNIRQQRILGGLTFALVFIGAVQLAITLLNNN